MADLRGRKMVTGTFCLKGPKGASHKRCLSPFSSARRGVTLVELLVVIGIMLILATIAIPAMRPLTEGRRVREAARAINVYLGRARSRAIESGRPCGVMFERLERQPNACVLLRQAEVPPPYSGETSDSAVRPYAQAGGFVRVRIRYGQFASGLVRRGDTVRLNRQGPFYSIVDYLSDNNPADSVSPPADPGEDFPLDANNQFIDFYTGAVFDPADPEQWVSNRCLTLAVSSDSVSALPWGSASIPVPFEILRQPVASAGAPLQLSRGAVIDLDASGLDRRLPFQLVDPSAPDNPPVNPLPLPLPLPLGDPRSWPVIVMFSPNGSIDSVYHYELLYDTSGAVVGGRYTARRAVEPIHLMVGKWERIPPQPGLASQTDDGLPNWQDATNLWLAISPQTGLVTVAEPSTYYVDSTDGELKDNYDPVTNLSVPATLYDSRRLARQAQVSKGGR